MIEEIACIYSNSKGFRIHRCSPTA
uniref:Uncharacterized protein n=1 Tax=Anguilla anguilla TaxID=7936 RepID=A0A0E9UUU2_ANGAN